jgi:LPS-assembly lipoprotein
MRKGLIYLSLLLVGWLAVGCGFHLRGSTPLPPGVSPAYIQARSGSILSPVLAGALRTGGVQMAAAPADAKLTIRILNEKSDSRVLAVNKAGKVIAYELSYRVEFDAAGPGAAHPVERQTVEQAREYVNADIEVLGKEQEADLIRQDMLNDVAERVLRRLLAQLS